MKSIFYWHLPFFSPSGITAFKLVCTSNVGTLGTEMFGVGNFWLDVRIIIFDMGPFKYYVSMVLAFSGPPTYVIFVSLDCTYI